MLAAVLEFYLFFQFAGLGIGGPPGRGGGRGGKNDFSKLD